MDVHYTNTTQEAACTTQKFTFMHNYSCKVIIRIDAIKRDGTAALGLQVFINGDRKVFKIGISVNPKYFDRKQRKITLPPDQRQRQAEWNMLIRNAENKAVPPPQAALTRAKNFKKVVTC